MRIGFPQFVAFLILTVGIAAGSTAAKRPSKIAPVVSPHSYSDSRYQNSASSDFRNSDRFDIKNPIKAQIIVHRISIPENGYAELLFTYPGDAELKRSAELKDPDARIAPYRVATLQTAEEVRRLRITEESFENGVEATITGWPATRWQRPYSELLIDEIEFNSGNKKLVLQPETEEMVKYKNRSQVPVDSTAQDDPSEKSGGG